MHSLPWKIPVALQCSHGAGILSVIVFLVAFPGGDTIKSGIKPSFHPQGLS